MGGWSFLLTMPSVEDVAVRGLWSCGEVEIQARGEAKRSEAKLRVWPGLIWLASWRPASFRLRIATE